LLETYQLILIYHAVIVAIYVTTEDTVMQ